MAEPEISPGNAHFFHTYVRQIYAREFRASLGL